MFHLLAELDIELNWGFPLRLGLFWRGRGINKSHLRRWCMTVDTQSEFLYSSKVLLMQLSLL